MSRECPICGLMCESFLPGGRNHRPNAMCPRCRSLERHRLVWLYLQTETDLVSAVTPRRLLHIAPEPALERRLGKLPGIDQLTADLDPRGVMVQMDITAIDYPDDSFETIYCSHVLEHVSDDAAALGELLRVLRPGGWAILQVPISRELTDEDATVTDAAERTRRFGQDDHVRSYGRDYPERLARAGFRVTVDPYPRRIGLACVERFGLTLHEEVHCARKPGGGGPGGVERLLNGWGADGPVVIGRVEQVRDGAVAGWAFRPAAPAGRASVRVLVDGVDAGESVADLARPSLAEAGIGDGRSGFTVTLPTTLASPGQHTLRVEADGVALLAANGFATRADRAPWDGADFRLDAGPRAGERPPVAGHVESVSDRVVSGWAWSPAAPGWRVGVRAILDGRDVGGDVAGHSRRSLAQAWISDGRCGFEISLPEVGSGPHGLRIEIEGGAALPPAASFTTDLRGGDPWYVVDVGPTRL